MSLVAVIAAAALSQASPGDVVRTCNDAPAGAGLASVGHFEQRQGRLRGGIPAIDVSENACAPAAPRPPSPVTDGLQLRVVPRPAGGELPRGTQGRATLSAPRGRTFADYSAEFGALRTDPGYALRLRAVTAQGEREVVWEATGDGGPPERRDFDLPAQTVRVQWILACVAATCSSAATGDAATRGLPASLNVYGSTALFD